MTINLLSPFVDLDDELTAFLLQFPGVVDEIGDRLTPSPLPQASVLPAVTYSDVSDVGDHTGPEGRGAYHLLRYQIDSWADSKHEARRVDGKIRVVLDGYRGAMGGRSVVAIRKNTVSIYEPETTLWHVISDYLIHIEK
ncbi:MAG: hypothetical protein KDE56_27090 [Anaerolineales bacterium]|nr:hypothetical protein [Anaerolineales bacterium]